MVSLRPMTQPEYDRFLEYGIEDYAQQRAKSLRSPIEHEREESARQFAELLKDGLQTENHRLWMIVRDNGDAVGTLWVHLNPEQQHAFIFSIVIDEQFRGQGYGKQTLDALDNELRAAGIKRLALNVFSENEVAIRLYQKHGFTPTNFNMQKDL